MDLIIPAVGGASAWKFPNLGPSTTRAYGKLGLNQRSTAKFVNRELTKLWHRLQIQQHTARSALLAITTSHEPVGSRIAQSYLFFSSQLDPQSKIEIHERRTMTDSTV